MQVGAASERLLGPQVGSQTPRRVEKARVSCDQSAAEFQMDAEGVMRGEKMDDAGPAWASRVAAGEGRLRQLVVAIACDSRWASWTAVGAAVGRQQGFLTELRQVKMELQARAPFGGLAGPFGWMRLQKRRLSPGDQEAAWTACA